MMVPLDAFVLLFIAAASAEMVSASQAVKGMLLIGARGLQHATAAAAVDPVANASVALSAAAVDPGAKASGGGSSEGGGQGGFLVAAPTAVSLLLDPGGGMASAFLAAGDTVAAGASRQHRRRFFGQQREEQQQKLSRQHEHPRWQQQQQQQQQQYLRTQDIQESKLSVDKRSQHSSWGRGRQQATTPSSSWHGGLHPRQPVEGFLRQSSSQQHHRDEHPAGRRGDGNLEGDRRHQKQQQQQQQHAQERRQHDQPVSGRRQQPLPRQPGPLHQDERREQRRQHQPHHHQQRYHQRQRRQQQQQQQQQQQRQRQRQQEPHDHEQQQQRQGRRRRQQSSASSASCSGYSDLAPSILADPLWRVDHDFEGLESYDFSCSDGEFLVEALPVVVENYYTSRRNTLSVKLIQSIRWTCSDGEQSEAAEAGDFSTSPESTSWTADYAAVARASFSVAITGVTALYLPSPDCETTDRGVIDMDRCYHVGTMAFNGYDRIAGVARASSIGTFADDGYFDGGRETSTECDADSYATGFSASQDGQGLLELTLVCAEYVAGVCEPPGLESGGTTPSPSSQRSNDDASGGADATPAWPPSWWSKDGTGGGITTIVAVIFVFCVLGCVSKALKACARKLCRGFSDHEGDWGGDPGPLADPDGHGGGGGGLGGNDNSAHGQSPRGTGGAGASWGGGGGGGGGSGSGGGRGVEGNWGAPGTTAAAYTATDGNYAGYRHAGYGAAAPASPTSPPTSALAPNYGNYGNHSSTSSGNQGRAVPAGAPALATGPPTPGGAVGSVGAGGYYGAVPSRTPPSGEFSRGDFAGVPSPPRLESPTAPPASEWEGEGSDLALQEALSASRQQQQQQRDEGRGRDEDEENDGLYLPVAVPVSD